MGALGTPEPVETPAGKYPAEDQREPGSRQRSGRDLTWNAAVGEQRDDVRQGAVDRDDIKQKRDCKSPEEPGTKRFACGHPGRNRRGDSRLPAPPRMGGNTGWLP